MNSENVDSPAKSTPAPSRPPRPASRWSYRILRFLPKTALSRLAGALARSPISRLAIPWFIHHYRVEVADTLAPESGYPSLQAFFCRQLKPGARPIAPPPGLIAPVDAVVGACGRIERGRLLQAKLRPYALADLLGGDPALAASLLDGLYCTLYLAPGSYHRIHVPLAATLTQSRFLPGGLWPVNPRAVACVPGLFAENERVIVTLDSATATAPFVLVLVGACLVGGIRLAAGLGDSLSRGQELGWFEFGSTVIVLMPPATHLEWAVATGDRVRMGQPLARLCDETAIP